MWLLIFICWCMSTWVLEILNVSELEQEILFPRVWEPPTFDMITEGKMWGRKKHCRGLVIYMNYNGIFFDAPKYIHGLNTEGPLNCFPLLFYFRSCLCLHIGPHTRSSCPAHRTFKAMYCSGFFYSKQSLFYKLEP